MSNKKFKVTNNTSEMSFYELFTQSNQIQIPLFQRKYVWASTQLDRMMREIDNVHSGKDDNRFLGAIISVARNPDPPKPQIYEIVDGQQRLTTLYLLVLCAAYVASKSDEANYAIGLINASLIVSYWTEGPNTKLLPSFEDRGQFNAIFNRVRSVGAISDQLAGKIILAGEQSDPSGRLWKQFERIRRVLENKIKTNGIEYLKEIVNVATTKLTFVFIILADASNATTVFEGLNDPGIPIGIGDLVRNEVFSKIDDDAIMAKEVHDNTWKPFKDSLGDGFDDYFFPFGIARNPTIKRSDLFRELRESWADHEHPAEIIADLSEYVPDYKLIISGEGHSKYPPSVAAGVKKLRELGAPTSTYPFLFHLLKAVRDEELSTQKAVECLHSLESFLVRRAIVGREPTGLLVFFRTAWRTMNREGVEISFREAMQTRGTIEWPNSEQVVDAVVNREIYRSKIRNFLLAEYDRSLGGDVPADVPWVEHILPQSLNESWEKSANAPEFFDGELHKKLRHTWGNLVPLSQQMNQALSQSKYEKKRAVILEDSMYKSARLAAKSN